MNKKISFPIAIIIIVVCAVLVGVIVWQYSIIPGIGPTFTPVPPKDETADWKTYRNEEYGFEMKYPANWVLDERGVTELVYLFNFGESGWPNSNKLALEVGPESFIAQFYKHPEKICTESALSNEGAYRCEGTDFIYVEAEHNGKFYLWSVFGEKGLEKIKIFEKILSTFRFIETAETADWKIYRNEKYGIEFKYPALWVLDEKNVLSVNLPDQTRNFIQINISNGVKGSEDESMSLCQPGIAAIVYQIGKLRDNQQSFEEFVNFQIENPERGMPPIVKPKLIPAMIGGHNALKIEKIVDNCKTEFFYVEQDFDHYMTISFIVDKNDDKLVIDQILSTFTQH